MPPEYQNQLNEQTIYPYIPEEKERYGSEDSTSSADTAPSNAVDTANEEEAPTESELMDPMCSSMVANCKSCLN